MVAGRQAQKSPAQSLAETRQVKSIADLINHGHWQSALESCDQVLKSKGDSRSSGAIHALKGLACVGLHDFKEAQECADKAGQAGGPYLYSLLRALNQWDHLVRALESDGLDTFPALIEAGQWARASSTASRDGERRRYWALVALTKATQDDPACLPELARLMQDHFKDSEQNYKTEHELFACVHALQALGKKEEALDRLCSRQGADFCRRSLMLELLRSKWSRDLGRWQPLHDTAMQRLLSGDDNWQWVTDLMVSSVKLGRESDLRQYLVDWSKERPDARAPSLALLDFFDCMKDYDAMLTVCESHFTKFASKPVCYEDLKIVGRMSPTHISRFVAFAESLYKNDVITAQDVIRRINVAKLRLWLGQDIPISELFKEYQDFLRIGKALARTELQPCDDFGLMSAQKCIRAWAKTRRSGSLFTASAILETLLLRSPANFQARLLLVRCYTLLAVSDAALPHFENLGLRVIQHDSLSYFMTMNVSSIWPNRPHVERLFEPISKFYEDTKRQLPGLLAGVFEDGTYANVFDFSEFDSKLEWSIERALKWIELFELELVTASGPGQALEKCLALLRDPEMQRLVMRAAQVKLSDNRDLGLLNTFDVQGAEVMERITRPGISNSSKVKMFANIYHAMGQRVVGLELMTHVSESAKPESDGSALHPLESLYAGLVYGLAKMHESAFKADGQGLVLVVSDLEARLSELTALLDLELRSVDEECQKFDHMTIQSISLLLKCHLLLALQPSLLSSSGYVKTLSKDTWTALVEAVRRIVKQATSSLKLIKPLVIKLAADLRREASVQSFTKDATAFGMNENLAHQFAIKCRQRQADNLELLLQVIKARTK